MAGYVDVRAYAVLNDFVAPESPGVTVRRPFRSHQTVKDVLEAMGITHTKVDLILVNGDAVGFPTGRPLATVSPHTRCSSARHRVHGPAAAGAAASSPLRRRCQPRSVGAAASGWTCGRRVTPTTRPLPMSACHGRTQLPAPQAPAAPPASQPPLGPIDIHRGPHLGNYLTATLEATRPDSTAPLCFRGSDGAVREIPMACPTRSDRSYRRHKRQRRCRRRALVGITGWRTRRHCRPKWSHGNTRGCALDIGSIPNKSMLAPDHSGL
jgi:hypothetical protein